MSEGKSGAEGPRAYARILIELAVTIVVLVTIGAFLTFEHASLGITNFYADVARLVLLVVGTLTVLALVHGPLKHQMGVRGGAHFASTFSFFGTIIVLVAAFVALLGDLSIPPTTFLVAVGGLGIVVGFAVSTVTTNIIAGAFMLTSFPIKIGQRIIITVNNQPGTITGVSTLFMTVTTDAGAKLIIPNSAIFQGMAFLLDIGASRSKGEDGVPKLLARPGDRVISTLYPYPATVTEVTNMSTRLTTDGGAIITIPNQALLNGSSALVKLEGGEASPKFPIAVGDEVRLSSGDFTGKITEIGSYYFRVSGAQEDVLIPMVSLTTGGVFVFKKKGAPAPEGGTKPSTGNML